MIGTLAVASRSRRQKRSFTIGAVAGTVLPIALLIVFSLLPRGGSGTGAPSSPETIQQRQALTTFANALQPLIDRGGATVVYGMRPGINDIHSQALDDEVLASMAQGWIDTTAGLRDEFAAIEAPEFLAETADLYQQAFDAYHETARALLAASNATGAERARHIGEAADAGTRGDQLYDTAKAQLGDHRQRLGM